MLAYVRLIQSREKELGVEVLTHQKWSGAPYMDGILGAIQSGSSSSKSMGEGNTEKGKLSIHFDLLAINANNPKLQASKQIPRHGRIIIMPSVLLDRCRDKKNPHSSPELSRECPQFQRLLPSSKILQDTTNPFTVWSQSIIVKYSRNT